MKTGAASFENKTGRSCYNFLSGEFEMRSRLLASSVVALSLVAAPVLAQAEPAARTSAPVSEESEFFGGNFIWIIVAIAAIVGAILLLDDDDDPVSP